MTQSNVIDTTAEIGSATSIDETSPVTPEMEQVYFSFAGQRIYPYRCLTPIPSRNGTKYYLEVKYRIMWFRAEHPDYVLRTELVEHVAGVFAVFRAHVENADGRLIAEGWGSSSKAEFKDYIEKAETAAKGRCLADLGYGTVFAIEYDELGKPVDSPAAAVSKGQQSNKSQNKNAQNGRSQPAQTSNAVMVPAQEDDEQATMRLRDEIVSRHIPLKNGTQSARLSHFIRLTFKEEIAAGTTTVESYNRPLTKDERQKVFRVIKRYVEALETQKQTS